MSFGGFQTSQKDKPRELPKHMTAKNKWYCLVCGVSMMSDEALQMHRIWHSILALNERIDKLIETGERMDAHFDAMVQKLEA